MSDPQQPDLPESNDPQPGDAPATRPDAIVDLNIEQELAESYLTYAMSTIVDRALPDVRDGLKPSQRRILVAMHDLNLTPGRKHSKCAGIVGETMKKYHPHGDAAIYPTLVNMAQDWKTRCLLIDKQGNFGSIDPDPPAAMRYTEARMHAHAVELLEDLKLDTVDYRPNFDEQYEEPTVLPAKFPNLLVNGSTGIAVGMASSMPPHNLGEVCDAITAVVDNPSIEFSDLMQIIPGPDFPTGGIIMGRSGIAEAYATGRGRVYVRAKIEHEETKTRNRLVVKELPYQVSKNDSVIKKIVQLSKLGKLTDIANVVDESSNRGGMRLVIELKRGADPHVVENQLYALTPLQSTFSIANIALVRGRPVTLPLKGLIQEYITHRLEVIQRRTRYRLNQAQQEAHRIEGLIYAVCDIDEVIKLIRSSRTRDEAIQKLMARGFAIPAGHEHAPKIPARLMAQCAENPVILSRVQAESIGRLQLIQLVGLEIEKLVADYAKLVAQIEEYESILASHQRQLDIIKEEIGLIKDKYADPRRTVIDAHEVVAGFDIGALTPEQTVAVTITHGGYIKRLPVEEYRTQGRGGKGVKGASMKDDDFTEHVFVANTHHDLMCFTDTGRVFKIKVYDIPEAPRTNRGKHVVNILDLKDGERIKQWMPIEDFEKGEHYLMFATAQGLVKRTALKEYRNVNKSGIIAINLKEGDELVDVIWTAGQDHAMLATTQGMAIRFSEEDARVMGRNASGVKGISLSGNAKVVAMVKIPEGDETLILTASQNGYGKRTDSVEYLVQSEDGSTRAQGRGGKGRKDMNVTTKTGEVIAMKALAEGDDLMLITQSGMIVRIEADTVRQTGRGTQGVKMIDVKSGDRLVAVGRVVSDDDDAPGSEAPEGASGNDAAANDAPAGDDA